MNLTGSPVTLFRDGVSYAKRDNECAHFGCKANIDFHVHDKPPPGWAHVTINRYGSGKKFIASEGYTGQTFLLCPDHTISFTQRQELLVSAGNVVSQAINKIVRIVIESPFAGDLGKNLKFLRAAMRECLLQGEAPYASHALYTQEGVLRDEDPEERRLGMEAGFRWGQVAQKVVVYDNLGISEGMKKGIARAKEVGIPIEYRKLKDPP
jgi:hypothetical protein